MSTVDLYVHAATRDNTRRSYRSAIAHYEMEWGGFLPATADSVARYLVDHAQTLAINTLRQRLAALAQWHLDQGMPDPTKSPLVKKVLRGIRALHPVQQKQAKPLQLAQLEQLDAWLAQQIVNASAQGNQTALLKCVRDRALVLLGFWRGFRSDELSRLAIEHITLVPGEGMAMYLPHTKTDRAHQGTVFKAPALSRLCPVTAYQQWIEVTQLTSGPVFRAINRWGHISDDALHPTSFIQLLRSLFAQAQIPLADQYSSHSLRRGFASWANSNGWELKTLMDYVGWKDMRSALRYIDSPDPFARTRIEQQLQQPASIALMESAPTTRQSTLELVFTLESFTTRQRGLEKARTAIEACCLKSYSMEKSADKQHAYRLTLAHETPDQLNEAIDSLLDEMHQIAASHQCFLDATLTDPLTHTLWQ